MRLFQVLSVDKKSMKIPMDKLFTGTPSAAARKAMTVLCGNKKNCTLTLKIREVKRVMRDGETTVVPVLDRDNMQIVRKYRVQRVENDTPVVFEGSTPVTFRYKTDILESFGRVA